MNRRDALRYTAISLGYALTATTTSAVLSGCQADPSPDWLPSTLSEQQVHALAAIAETILPATESSPGARDVFVHRFIDELLTHWASEETRREWLTHFDTLQEEISQEETNGFDTLTPEKQHLILSDINQRALTVSDPTPVDRFFRELKGMIVSGYFSSEQVGKEILAYDPIPGEYQGCIPYEEVGKLWSL